MDELRPGSEDREPEAGLLGDIVLCPSVAERQARDAGHATEEELLLLTTHGILHLLGYDHAEPEEEREMFELQRQLLLTFLAGRGQRLTVVDAGPRVLLVVLAVLLTGLGGFLAAGRGRRVSRMSRVRAGRAGRRGPAGRRARWSWSSRDTAPYLSVATFLRVVASPVPRC